MTILIEGAIYKQTLVNSYSKGVLAKSNAQLVERVVRIAREFGREIVNPTETRKILSLF
jgi:uncharacterized protein (DUF849 family)